MSSVQCLQIFSKYLVADYQIKVRERERERAGSGVLNVTAGWDDLLRVLMFMIAITCYGVTIPRFVHWKFRQNKLYLRH